MTRKENYAYKVFYEPIPACGLSPDIRLFIALYVSLIKVFFPKGIRDKLP
jgi:hypothetical protein